MRILLHDNCLTERGTTTSVVNYARALRNLGFDVFIGYNAEHSIPSDPRVINSLSSEFDLVHYSSLAELRKFGRDLNLDFFYAQKGGVRDGVEIPGTQNLVHAVFQMLEPHGNRYAFISSWLERAVAKSLKRRVRSLQAAFRTKQLGPLAASLRMRYPYVPYIVSVPEPQNDYRHPLGISSDAKVIGTLCGSSEFNIPFVRAWVLEQAQRNHDLVFLFPNIPSFCDLPNVKFLPRITSSTEKADFLKSLNVFLHARQIGETFGLAIHEALALGIPVMSFEGGRDKNHVALLQKTGWLYKGKSDLDRLTLELDSRRRDHAETARDLVAEYTANQVMPRFQSVFFH